MNSSVKHVFISPHFDDVCFSLGNYITSCQNSCLVNVFSRCNYIANLTILNSFGNSVDRTEEISRIRAEEDKKFCFQNGLIQKNLGLSESTVVGKHPFDLDGIDSEIATVSNVLIQGLIDLHKTCSSEVVLYCPIGIGGHRNHVSTFLAVTENFHYLKNYYNICFYEDLPYAANHAARKNGIVRFHSFYKEANVTQYKRELDESEALEKIANLDFYKSQQSAQICSNSINFYDLNTISIESFYEVCQKD